ncbi:MAG: hypothetical protein IKI31_03140 [Treponema sp.]|nr:hypothetical protein [Treponema sp.]
MSDFFTKTSVLTNPEKASLLYTLIADNNSMVSSNLLSYFSRREQSKLKKEIKKFTKQRSFADKEKRRQDDIFVLEEVYRFGKEFNKLPKNAKPLTEKKSPQIDLNANASDVAKILSRWISEAK